MTVVKDPQFCFCHSTPIPCSLHRLKIANAQITSSSHLHTKLSHQPNIHICSLFSLVTALVLPPLSLPLVNMHHVTNNWSSFSIHFTLSLNPAFSFTRSTAFQFLQLSDMWNTAKMREGHIILWQNIWHSSEVVVVISFLRFLHFPPLVINVKYKLQFYCLLCYTLAIDSGLRRPRLELRGILW